MWYVRHFVPLARGHPEPLGSVSFSQSLLSLSLALIPLGFTSFLFILLSLTFVLSLSSLSYIAWRRPKLRSKICVLLCLFCCLHRQINSVWPTNNSSIFIRNNYKPELSRKRQLAYCPLLRPFAPDYWTSMIERPANWWDDTPWKVLLQHKTFEMGRATDTSVSPSTSVSASALYQDVVKFC